MKHFANLLGVGVRLLRHCKAGHAAVEFGLVSPIFLILLAGTLDYADYVYNQINLNGATRAAAEWGRNNFPSTSTTVTCTASATGICKYGNFPSGVSVTYAPVCTCVDNTAAGGTCPSAPTCSNSDSRVIEYVLVTATQSFTPTVPYTTLLVPLGSVTATSALRVQ